MSEGDGMPTEAERWEWLCWLVEDSLVLSSQEKLALLGKLDHLRESDQQQLLEILLDERGMLDRLRRKAFEGGGNEMNQDEQVARNLFDQGVAAYQAGHVKEALAL